VKHTLTRTCALSSAVLVLVALPASAFASTFQHTDATKDVQQVSGKSATTVPDQKVGDVVRFKAGYGTKQLTATTKMRDLTGKYFYDLQVKTPDTMFDVTVSHIGRGTQVMLSQSRSGKTVACSDLAHTIDTSKHTIALQVPAECLGSPTWVQVGAGMVTFTKKAVYADDALRKSGAQEKNLTLSKKLKP
jgi:hypothetical protein